jgi:hypothetical protein
LLLADYLSRVVDGYDGPILEIVGKRITLQGDERIVYAVGIQCTHVVDLGEYIVREDDEGAELVRVEMGKILVAVGQQHELGHKKPEELHNEGLVRKLLYVWEFHVVFVDLTLWKSFVVLVVVLNEWEN